MHAHTVLLTGHTGTTNITELCCKFETRLRQKQMWYLQQTVPYNLCSTPLTSILAYIPAIHLPRKQVMSCKCLSQEKRPIESRQISRKCKRTKRVFKLYCQSPRPRSQRKKKTLTRFVVRAHDHGDNLYKKFPLGGNTRSYFKRNGFVINAMKSLASVNYSRIYSIFQVIHSSYGN